MKSSRTSLLTRIAFRKGDGFTLVEVLVAIAVLAIIVLFFGQMLGTMSNAWTYGHSRANNFTKARAMLDLLARDIESAILRPDLAAFPVSGTNANPPSWEFYTARLGIPGGVTSASTLRAACVVQYTFIGPTNPNGGIPNTLERADSPILWSDEATNPVFGNITGFAGTLTPRDTAPGVIAFELIFIQSNGTFSTTYTPLTTAGVANANPTRAVSVTLAVMDDVTLQKMSSAQLTNLNSLLTSAITDNPPVRSVKAYWDAYLDGGALNWHGYAGNTGAGLATFERYVTLPDAP